MIKINDGLPPSTFETYAANISCEINKNEQLIIMALADDYTSMLQNRWIVDPGSNTIVINSELQKEWRLERENYEGLK